MHVDSNSTGQDWASELWPDAEHRPYESGVPPVDVGTGRRGVRGLALALTFVIALGAGAGAVESVTVLGRVIAVGHQSVTVGGGPGQAISARVTSATQYTGTVRSLAQVRVGDTVTAHITVSDGVARLISLQDPASQP
jgi:hypothetical protein